MTSVEGENFNGQEQSNAEELAAKQYKIIFANITKMSPNLIELRIDNHLNRIMKNHRLMNFCNAIKNLPIQARLCEKLIEIMNSCEALIERKMPMITEAKDVLLQLRQIHRLMETRINPKDNDDGDDDYKFDGKERMMKMFDRIKQVSTNTEQIVWALNSNKEHLRYIARVWVMPKIYYRSFSLGGQQQPQQQSARSQTQNVPGSMELYGNSNQNDESIMMRSQLIMVIGQCENIIDICKLLRVSIASLMKDIYATIEVDPRSCSKE